MTNRLYKFKAKIHIVPNKGGAYIEFPYDIRKEFGKGRVKVHVTFDDIPYDGSIVNIGIKNPDGSICLHARRVRFVHPVSKELIALEAPLPDGNLWKGFELF